MAAGGFPGRLEGVRRPPRLRLARPELTAERAQFWLVLEQGSGHLNNHARTSCHESMITLTAPRAEAPGPGPAEVRQLRPARRSPGRNRPGHVCLGYRTGSPGHTSRASQTGPDWSRDRIRRTVGLMPESAEEPQPRPSPGALWSNWVTYDAPFAAKVRMAASNTFIKLRKHQACCGNNGQPGC